MARFSPPALPIRFPFDFENKSRIEQMHLFPYHRLWPVDTERSTEFIHYVLNLEDAHVSTVHYYWEQSSRDSNVSRRPGSGWPQGTTEREDHHIRRLAVAHRTASAAEIRATVCTSATQRTVRNWLIQGQLQAKRPVACIQLTPSNCCLRRQWCQARAHWRTEWRSVVFSDESRFCLGASDGGVLVRRVGKCLQPNCLRP
ncbi:transposable element Tc1 transposase [Trichonephila clavipes]|nr:transposable element Tc1 transposase [Trichonephila clavipes]